MNTRSHARRIAATAGAAGLLTASALTTGTFLPLAAAEPSTCADNEVTVVVEGEGQGCAPGGVTGWEALEKAGFSVTPVEQFDGLVCQINQKPVNADCSKAPEMDAYWGYYSAPLGGEWNFSQKGANEQIAEAGKAEGWAFGNGAKPSAVPTKSEQGAAGEQDSASNEAESASEENNNAWTSILGALLVLAAGLAVYFFYKRSERKR
ncbi:LPXTG cell wall anchor domain-containing protein [Corynebacterium dentalis]|uniref:LPXTG cell wall anchor domain-containing protein n=1 Tax=Corynebacterium dentalis TaxID=2014528 RepID=UPI000C07B16D|nr:LPXTG cell wall anchor domain-containing protein [Corynebacterium dentalis]